ncbi:isoprenyl transferase [Sphingomonas sp.]|uniref:isoprenyl transferase n=1 Tax=Sphingomonas sp. TaxID=28214 RepID=UPI001B26F1DD|nr:isoprenyl transferase [Sphingomonas sp.]MBO9711924.1 isoprenyl transferase [Sphingomonas sp.]
MAAKAKPVPVPSVVPRHVAIIMDGNGRWAKARFLPRIAGHRQGVEAVRRISRAARSFGIEVLTLYAFSSENWRRPEEEVRDLMGLLRHFLAAELDELVSEGVKLKIIGGWRMLSPDIVAQLEGAMARTADNPGPTLVIALNYGGQAEIIAATQALAEQARRGEIDPADIDEARFEAALETQGLPPLDLLIRTSGEQRLSNFLLWQAAYAELLFVDALWPDFDEAKLGEALEQYARRQRRFGGL